MQELDKALFQFELSVSKRKYMPIVYNNNYNVHFYGFERFLPFYTYKWARTHELIEEHLKVLPFFVFNKCIHAFYQIKEQALFNDKREWPRVGGVGGLNRGFNVYKNIHSNLYKCTSSGP